MPATSVVSTVCSWCGTSVTLTTKSQIGNYRARQRAYCSPAHGREFVKATMKRRGMPPQALAVRHAQVKKANPMHSSATRAKLSVSLKAMGHKPAKQGGNGRGLSPAELALSQATGLRPYVVPTGGRGHGFPTHYKLDLADPSVMLAVEIDGGSHNALKVRDADRRKEEFLRSRGWTVLRFTNSQALTDTTACVLVVSSTTSKLKANTPT